MIGTKVLVWLEALHEEGTERQRKAARNLLNTSEHYFDSKKVSQETRVDLHRAWMPLASSSDPLVRECVAQLTGLLRIWSESGGILLRRLLVDEVAEVRVAAVWAAGHIGSTAGSLVPVLLTLLPQPEQKVRWRIAWALNEIGHCDDRVIQAICGLAGDEDVLTRMSAYNAIAGLVESPSGNAAQKVLAGLEDGDDGVCAAACVAIGLGNHFDPSTAEVLIRMAANGSHGVQAAAIIALYRAWPDRISHPAVMTFLQSNLGYWWAEAMLRGEPVRVRRADNRI